MSHLATISCIPHKTLLIAGKVKRIIKESVVRLITTHYIGPHLAHRQYRRTIEHYNTSQSIRAIHQACRTFEYLYRMNRSCIYLNSMLIAPLLTFLTNSVIYYNHTIITHSSYHRFGNTATSGYLRHSRLTAYGINDICGRLGFKLFWRHNTYRRSRCYKLLLPC